MVPSSCVVQSGKYLEGCRPETLRQRFCDVAEAERHLRTARFCVSVCHLVENPPPIRMGCALACFPPDQFSTVKAAALRSSTTDLRDATTRTTCAYVDSRFGCCEGKMLRPRFASAPGCVLGMPTTKASRNDTAIKKHPLTHII